MEIRHNIVLDASRPDVQCSLMMSTGDVSSHRVVIALRNRGEPVSLENVSGYVYFSKPDSTEVVQSAAVYWDNGSAAGVMTLVVNQQVLTAVGRVTCRAVLCGAEGEELYSPIFMIDVVSNPALDAAITSQSEYAALTEAKLEAQAWAEGKKGTVDVIDGQDQYRNNAKWYAEQAAALGEEKVKDAEAWATGQKDGVAVSSDAPQYHNSAKYHAENALAMAQAIAQMLEECETWEDGKSAYELAVENGFEGTEVEWLASLVGAAGQNGTNGQNGEDGQDGKSAYELAVENGFEGTEVEWLASLVGAAGQNGTNGTNGQDGKSAYEIAVENGFEGTEVEWLASLIGAAGQNGTNGQNGEDGQDGKSAYELAVENGFEGTEVEWLASLVGAAGQNGTNGQNGEDGQDGKSAYEIAVENGFEGTEVEWLASLVGAAGQNGSAGAAGKSAYAAAVEAGYSGTEAQFNADLSAVGGKQDSVTTSTVTLTIGGWSNNTQTVSVTGVTTSKNVIVSPAPASTVDYANAGVYCSAQGSGTLTFTCSTTPTTALTVDVMVI